MTAGWLSQWLARPFVQREKFVADSAEPSLSHDTARPTIDLTLADLACDLACCQHPLEQLPSLLVPVIAWYQRPLAQHQAQLKALYLPSSCLPPAGSTPATHTTSEQYGDTVEIPLSSTTTPASAPRAAQQCWVELPLGNSQALASASTTSTSTASPTASPAGTASTASTTTTATHVKAWLLIDCPAQHQAEVRKLLSPLQRSLVRGLSGWWQRDQQLKQERRALIERERRWQAAELHDSVAQVLGYVRLRSAQLATRCQETGSDALVAHADDLSQQCHHAYRQTRELIAMSRLAIQGEQFLPALRDAIQDLESRSTLVFELDNRCGELALTDVEATQALYIVREALCNVVRHACASHARVKIYESCGQRVLLVEDNGSGIQRARQQGSFGLQIMAERAQRMGGKLVIRKRQPNGTRIELVLPGTTGSDHHAG